MSRTQIPVWLRTLLATLAGVVVFVILALMWNLFAGLVALLVFGISRHTAPLKGALVYTLVLIIPYVGFVFAARFFAASISGGKASLPTALIAGGLTALFAAYTLFYWFFMH